MGAELGENQWVRLAVHRPVCPNHHLATRAGRRLNGQNGQDWGRNGFPVWRSDIREEVAEVATRLWSQPKLDFVMFWTFVVIILGGGEVFWGFFFQFSLRKTEEGEAGAQGDLRHQKHENIGKPGRTRSNGGRTGATGNTGRTGSSLVIRCRSNSKGRPRCCGSS